VPEASRKYYSLSLVLGGEGRGEGPSVKLRHFAMKGQLDVPPLTLTLSPEYEGEGTGEALEPA
jgi:hypothetical protein